MPGVGRPADRGQALRLLSPPAAYYLEHTSRTKEEFVLRKILSLLVAVIAVAVAACGAGPMEPMPGGDDMMLIPQASAPVDTLRR